MIVDIHASLNNIDKFGYLIAHVQNQQNTSKKAKISVEDDDTVKVDLAIRELEIEKRKIALEERKMRFEVKRIAAQKDGAGNE